MDNPNNYLFQKYMVMPLNITELNCYIMQILIDLMFKPTQYYSKSINRHCCHCGYISSANHNRCIICRTTKCPTTFCSIFIANRNLCIKHQFCYVCGEALFGESTIGCWNRLCSRCPL